MRIAKLDLIAFGPFTDQVLDFGAGTGLHLIYGPNEAGKSTALRGLHQWLFGIAPKGYDFVHARANLRIGGTLIDAAGAQLSCIRRKGIKNSLRAADDVEPIDSERFNSLLSGMDSSAFQQQFGISYESLVAGGQEIIRGDGQVGEALFSAASGIVGLNDLRQRYEDEAKALFAPRAIKAQINKAVAELKDLQKKVREERLSEMQWKQHDDALRNTQEKLSQIEETLLEQTGQLNRLQRYQQALPMIASRQQLITQLSEMDDRPILSEGFSTRRQKVQDDLLRSQANEAQAIEKLHRIEQSLEQLGEVDLLIEHAAEIKRLHSEAGKHQEREEDRPARVAELDKNRALVQERLQQLRWELTPDQVDDAIPSTVERGRIETLARQFERVQDRQTGSRRELEQHRKLHEDATTERANLGDVVNVSPMRRAVEEVRSHGDLEQRLKNLRTQVSENRERAQIALKKLGLWTASLDELESASLPTIETIGLHHDRLREVANRIESLQREQASCQSEERALELEIESLRRHHDVPTEEDLANARQTRDQGWELVRQMLEGADSSSPHEEFTAKFSAAENISQAFRISIEQADELADRLRREAEQAARKAGLLLDCQKMAARNAEAVSAINTTLVEQQQLEEDWQAVWRPINVEPLSPAEMRPWHTHATGLANGAGDLRRENIELVALEQELEQLHGNLRQQLTAHHVETHSLSKSLGSLLADCDAYLIQADQFSRQHERSAEELGRLEEKQIDLEVAVQLADVELTEWNTQWAAAIESLRLDSKATPADASAVLRTLDELVIHRRDISSLQTRIAGIDERGSQFKHQVTSLLSLLSETEDDSLPDQKVTQLYDRYTRAVSNAADRKQLVTRIQEETDLRDSAASAKLQAQQQSDALCREAHCNFADELADAERASSEHITLEQELKEQNNLLLQHASGTEIELFVSQAQEHPSEELNAAVDRLTQETNDLQREKDQLWEQIGRERNQLEQFGQASSVAADASERAEMVAAQIRDDAEQYVRKTMAAKVLAGATERYRQRHQGAVLARASELFSELSGGSFEGLRVEYENDKPVLVGVRPDGKTVSVPRVKKKKDAKGKLDEDAKGRLDKAPKSGLSDGTCDQLYLALRLASLEEYLDRATPIPFIVDDILINFDDKRSSAALKILAALGKKTQVIFFTHHEHILELARDTIDESHFCTHRLDWRSEPTIEHVSPAVVEF